MTIFKLKAISTQSILEKREEEFQAQMALDHPLFLEMYFTLVATMMFTDINN